MKMLPTEHLLIKMGTHPLQLALAKDMENLIMNTSGLVMMVMDLKPNITEDELINTILHTDEYGTQAIKRTEETRIRYDFGEQTIRYLYKVIKTFNQTGKY